MVSTGNLDKESIDGTDIFHENLIKSKSISKNISENLKKYYENFKKRDAFEKYKAYCRDFAITLTDKNLVQHVLNVLKSDIAHQKIVKLILRLSLGLMNKEVLSYA